MLWPLCVSRLGMVSEIRGPDRYISRREIVCIAQSNHTLFSQQTLFSLKNRFMTSHTDDDTEEVGWGIPLPSRGKIRAISQHWGVVGPSNFDRLLFVAKTIQRHRDIKDDCNSLRCTRGMCEVHLHQAYLNTKTPIYDRGTNKPIKWENKEL